MTDREGLLRAIRENLNDDAPKLVFADFLDENDRVLRPDRGRLPRWLKTCWRVGTKDLRRGRPGPHYFGPTEGWVWQRSSRSDAEVMFELDNNQDRLGVEFDHPGTVAVAGIPDCFVIEPYGKIHRHLRAFDVLAEITGGIPGISRAADWNGDCVRVILFPPDAIADQQSQQSPIREQS